MDLAYYGPDYRKLLNGLDDAVGLPPRLIELHDEATRKLQLIRKGKSLMGTDLVHLVMLFKMELRLVRNKKLKGDPTDYLPVYPEIRKPPEEMVPKCWWRPDEQAKEYECDWIGKNTAGWHTIKLPNGEERNVRRGEIRFDKEVEAEQLETELTLADITY